MQRGPRSALMSCQTTSRGAENLRKALPLSSRISGIVKEMFLQTWTRRTMTQKKLTHLTVIHDHSDSFESAC